MEKFATRLCLTEKEAVDLYTLLSLLDKQGQEIHKGPIKRLEVWRKRWSKMLDEQGRTPKVFTESDKVFVKYRPEHRRSGHVGKVMKIEWWNHTWHYFVGFRDGEISWFLHSQLEKEV